MEQTKERNFTQEIQEMIDRVACPFQVFSENTSIEEINQIYEAAQIRGKKEGFTPILVCADRILIEWLTTQKERFPSEKEILQLQETSGENKLIEWKNWYQEHPLNENPGDFFQWEFKPRKKKELNSFQRRGELILFEIPVIHPWEVIAWMPIGGWNCCPDAVEMMTFCKKWYQECGAIPAVFSYNTLEFRIERPVKEKSLAWELAKEHYLFCNDCADFCTEIGLLRDIASSICQADTWFFWWD